MLCYFPWYMKRCVFDPKKYQVVWYLPIFVHVSLCCEEVYAWTVMQSIHIYIYIWANDIESFTSYPHTLTQRLFFLAPPTLLCLQTPPERYGLLLSGALLAALPTDVDRQKIMDYTYETFLGWRRMCELSKDCDQRKSSVCVCVWWLVEADDFYTPDPECC